ncbi:MAG: hypothetical protein ACRCSW_09410 [Tabrizicola sp.]
MRTLALAFVLLSGPAAADDCAAFWGAISDLREEAPQFNGRLAASDGDWCLVEDFVFETPGDYVPDWYVDRVRLKGSALPWLTGLINGGALTGLVPERLEIEVEGLRLVPKTGNAQMDWLFEAQSRPNRIDADVALAWDAAGKVLRVEALKIDFPGENLVEFSGEAKGVDLSSDGAMQMSVTSFAVTEADLRIRTHGLFEWYVLMPLGPSFLPYEGDIDAAAQGIKAEMTAAVVDLPGATFSPESKSALTTLIAEMPNPSGVLTLSLRSAAGVGPARVTGYAVSGMPATVQETAPFFDGVKIDVGWTHEDAP